jgi:hypothetical protein
MTGETPVAVLVLMMAAVSLLPFWVIDEVLAMPYSVMVALLPSPLWVICAELLDDPFWNEMLAT